MNPDRLAEIDEIPDAEWEATFERAERLEDPEPEGRLMTVEQGRGAFERVRREIDRQEAQTGLLLFL